MVTERMPYRLSDFGLLTYLECLYAMRCLLKGGILIENQFGYVSYHESMVYINECGQCKLWINNNLYSNEWVSASVNSVSQVEILMEYVEMRM